MAHVPIKAHMDPYMSNKLGFWIYIYKKTNKNKTTNQPQQTKTTKKQTT
jgi:hypothetical protein